MPGTIELEKPPIDTAETDAETIESLEGDGVEAFLRDVHAEIRATRDPETLKEMSAELNKNVYNHRLNSLTELHHDRENPQWQKVFGKQRQEPTGERVGGASKGERRLELTPIEVVVQELEEKNPDLQGVLQNFLRGPKEGLLNLLSQRNPKTHRGDELVERKITEKKEELLKRLPKNEEGEKIRAFVEHVADTEVPVFRRKQKIPEKTPFDRAA